VNTFALRNKLASFAGLALVGAFALAAQAALACGNPPLPNLFEADRALAIANLSPEDLAKARALRAAGDALIKDGYAAEDSLVQNRKYSEGLEAYRQLFDMLGLRFLIPHCASPRIKAR
jgi:hypothetical protein